MLLEQKVNSSSTTNEGIRLEDNSESEPHGILLEDEKDFDDGKHFVTNVINYNVNKHRRNIYCHSKKKFC